MTATATATATAKRGAGRATMAATLAVMAGALVLGRSSPARAQAYTVDEARSFRSPQHFAFEFRMGPYRPDIDSEFSSGRKPYETFFHGRHLMTQIELDWQFFHRYGSLAVGAGVGYFSTTANNPSVKTTGLTADTSNLRLIPFSLSLVYRYDYLFQDRQIPLVPYAKAGFDYSLWRVLDANGEVATDALGGQGAGGVLGWHAAVGVSLVLDFIDPDAARSFDDELGVNHTHLFFEFSHADISGLGEPNKIHLGDTTWSLGILFEF
ncbi:MAG TPA: MXAN_2562 family outer membrane beta-barrel protein [Polyangia bacterium]|nr:MXAN_2562 family outer membrane beta-barrel protein [Polyangia bacterium]